MHPLSTENSSSTQNSASAQDSASTENQFWLPSTATPANARKTAKQGCWAALLIVGGTIASPLASAWGNHLFLNHDTGSDLSLWETLNIPADVAIAIGIALIVYVAIAIGIYRMSRIAAIAGLTAYAVGQIYLGITQGIPILGLIFSVLMVFAFVNGIRGTFAYHRLNN